ncbi:uncharacterized protein [Ptychodera flava]|uniref:uncharacterized protein n=1 Tax=Ptychodera flava TaxID=63121 RepID=UPI003969EEB9
MAKEVQEAYCGTYKINIDVLQVRDNIRECDSLFLRNLKKQMEEFADEAYQPLCVVVEDVECSVDFDSKKINGYTYGVIGGQHCLEATKEISKSTKYSSDKRFKSRNCVVYCGLSAEQKQWLAVKHNSTGNTDML